MLIGLLAGIATGALWGLTFIAPLAVAPASAWDLTVVRYEIFGLACAALMISPRFRPGPMRLSHRVTGILLGALAFTGYVAGIFLAVRLAGVAIPPLVVGLSPLALALVAIPHQAYVFPRVPTFSRTVASSMTLESRKDANQITG